MTIRTFAAAFAMIAAPLAAQEEAAPAVEIAALDFSDVTTAEDLEPLVANGTLVPILFVPLAFGGSDTAINTVYVTPEAAAQKELADATLLELAEQGLLNSFELIPEHRGDSLVLTRMSFHANHKGEGERFDLTIEVW